MSVAHSDVTSEITAAGFLTAKRMRGKAQQGLKKNSERHHYFGHPELTAGSQGDSNVYGFLPVKLQRS